MTQSELGQKFDSCGQLTSRGTSLKTKKRRGLAHKKNLSLGPKGARVDFDFFCERVNQIYTWARRNSAKKIGDMSAFIATQSELRNVLVVVLKLVTPLTRGPEVAGPSASP